MRKKDIIEDICLETGMTRKQSSAVVNKFIEIIQNQVSLDRKITISGFGTFYLGKLSARKGINPQTGKRVKLSARRVPRFRAGARFRDQVN